MWQQMYFLQDPRKYGDNIWAIWVLIYVKRRIEILKETIAMEDNQKGIFNWGSIIPIFKSPAGNQYIKLLISGY